MVCYGTRYSLHLYEKLNRDTRQARRKEGGRKGDEVMRKERKIKVVRVLATVTTTVVGNKVLLMVAKHCEVHGKEFWIPMQKD